MSTGEDRGADFRTMADRIEANSDAPFGGAFVIIPPAGGETRGALMLDSSESPAMFWSQLKTIAEIAIAELSQDRQQQNAWGRR